jgi:hypothetical protein
MENLRTLNFNIKAQINLLLETRIRMHSMQMAIIRETEGYRTQGPESDIRSNMAHISQNKLEIL